MKTDHLLLLLLLNVCVAFGQGLDRDAYFNKTFDEVTGGESPHSVKGLKTPYFTYDLPQAFFDFVTHDSVAFGVSDALSDTAVAMEQAILRAQAMASLMEGCHIKSKGDFFTNELESDGLATKHLLLAQIACSSRAKYSKIKVVASFRTAYRETVVLVKITPLETKKVCVRGELFLSETSRNGELQMQSRVGLGISEPDGSSPKDTLSYQILDANFQYRSAFKGRKVADIERLRKYGQPNETSLSELELMSKGYSKAPLLHGLYPGFINAQLRQLRKASAEAIQSRKLNDVNHRKVTNLGDEKTVSTVTFKVGDVKIVQNHLYLKLDLKEQD